MSVLRNTEFRGKVNAETNHVSVMLCVQMSSNKRKYQGCLTQRCHGLKVSDQVSFFKPRKAGME
jgi:hypothetical protein